MRLLALLIVVGCGKPAPPAVPSNTQVRAGSAVVAEPVIEDHAAPIEDWKPGNHDRYRFEDPKTSKHGFKDGKGNVVIAARYAHVYEFSPSGVAAAIDGTTPFVFLDVTGKVIAQAYASDNGPDYFQEGHTRIRANGKVGYMTAGGRIAIAPKFDDAASFCRGKAEVELDGVTFYIDKQGNNVAPPTPDP